MTTARHKQISLHTTPFYHCASRCVRRAFLCGRDTESGRDYSHRKQWIVTRLMTLTSVFAIDLYAYAVMNNHYHVVVRIDENRALDWSDDQVITRWYKLFGRNALIDRHLAGEALSDEEAIVAMNTVASWRRRLCDLSWFMRCINERIARLANQEDACNGRFWEGRFRCQALLDETALIACMAYVDLNPVRAGTAKTPEESDFTSIQVRIQDYIAATPSNKKGGPDGVHSTNLQPLGHRRRHGEPTLSLPAYIELVDWTGRIVRTDKPGHIPKDILPILMRMKIEPNTWPFTIDRLGRIFYRVVGAAERIRQFSHAVGNRWMKGLSASRRLYRSVPA